MDVKLIPGTVIESLGRSGAADFDDLFKQVQKLHGDLNQNDFNKILMEMEVQGLIRVTRMTKGKRRVERG